MTKDRTQEFGRYQIGKLILVKILSSKSKELNLEIVISRGWTTLAADAKLHRNSSSFVL
jgi:hypothetical protein